MARPGVLCKLQKGKLIDVQEGFVETFNWMVDYINNLKGDDKNIQLDNPATTNPVIKFIGDDSGGDGEVTVEGTDGSSATGNTIFITGDENTNLKSTVKSVDGTIVVNIGVYYK